MIIIVNEKKKKIEKIYVMVRRLKKIKGDMVDRNENKK